MPSETVAIVEHKTSWSADFQIIATELRDVLGSIALGVDHIGSTAVPSLAAKNIIDIQVTVLRLDAAISEKLRVAGFSSCGEIVKRDHVPPGFEDREQDWTKLFFTQRTGDRRSNIHVRQLDKPNRRYALLVRDYLRANGSVAEAYGELKKRLALALSNSDCYSVVKDPVADIIYFSAESWALKTRWQPPGAA
ncbi:GrpB family protein [Acidovorax sp. sic0104]|uniref:GrpB family protein n=1 Tax=Acidovorax sp. sic0104 TaxID=2854784 RepID=UPI001C443249|nr:GrpB family protein [Acidovorax sp. sic0104]MBV7544646.1 GrpB family protein [Acidovorax sp. sic0104]